MSEIVPARYMTKTMPADKGYAHGHRFLRRNRAEKQQLHDRVSRQNEEHKTQARRLCIPISLRPRTSEVRLKIVWPSNSDCTEWLIWERRILGMHNRRACVLVFFILSGHPIIGVAVFLLYYGGESVSVSVALMLRHSLCHISCGHNFGTFSVLRIISRLCCYRICARLDCFEVEDGC